ncbi:hypothetical protein WDW89_18800 [Deltaproteobacteria bacterium TL4]
MKNKPNDIAEYKFILMWKNVLDSYAQANQSFVRYLSQESSQTIPQNIELLSSSFQSFHACLAHFNPVYCNLQWQTRSAFSFFLKKTLQWSDDQAPNQWVLNLYWIQRLNIFWEYQQSLKKLKHWIVALWIEQEPRLENSLRARLVLECLKFSRFERMLTFPFLRIKRYLKSHKKWLISGIVVSGLSLLLWIHYYFYSPYLVPSAFVFSASNKAVTYESYHDFKQIPSEFKGIADGEYHTVTFPLTTISTLRQIGFQFDLRWDSQLEIEWIRFLGERQQILKEMSFRTSEKQEWHKEYLLFAGSYQIQNQGLEELKRLEWAEPQIALLESLKDKIVDKHELRLLLEKLSGTWTEPELKVIRTVFRMPQYRQQGRFNHQHLTSTPLNINGVQSVQIRLKIGAEFKISW